ncbi:MAG: hypothetical protein ACOCQD_03540 [archaeon]
MANKRLEQIMGRWKEFLDSGKEIKNEKVKKATAVMLENESNFLTGRLDETTAWSGQGTAQHMDPSGGGYSTNAEFHKMAIPMIRRTFPELIAHDLVGVQPLTGPVGLAFALRFVADQSYSGDNLYGTSMTEVGYNNLDSSYSGSHELSAGEALGSKDGSGVGDEIGLGIGTGQHIKELSMTIEKKQVEAVTRKLRSRWSLEVAQDIKAMHGLDLEEEMMDVLSYEITAEIDRELIEQIRSVAATNSASDTWDYDAADGRWEMEKYRNLYNMIIRKSNRIAIDTRRGAGNFVVASPSMCAALEALDSFTIAPVDNDINTGVTGVARIGSIGGRMTVYRDTFATGDDLIVGYKGPSEYDTGIVYLPYIQLMQSRATFEDSFNPAIGLMSRYAILSNIYGAK